MQAHLRGTMRLSETKVGDRVRVLTRNDGVMVGSRTLAKDLAKGESTLIATVMKAHGSYRTLAWKTDEPVHPNSGVRACKPDEFPGYAKVFPVVGGWCDVE